MSKGRQPSLGSPLNSITKRVEQFEGIVEESCASVKECEKGIASDAFPALELPENPLGILQVQLLRFPRSGNGSTVDSKNCQVAIQEANFGAFRDHVHKKLAVPAGAILQVEAAYRFECTPSKKGRLLHPGGPTIEIAGTEKPVAFTRRTGIPANPNITVAHHQIACGVLFQKFGHLTYGVWKQQVVSVQKRENITRSPRKSLVEPVGRSLSGSNIFCVMRSP